MSDILERFLGAIFAATVFLLYMRFVENKKVKRKRLILEFIILSSVIFAIYLVAHTV